MVSSLACVRNLCGGARSARIRGLNSLVAACDKCTGRWVSMAFRDKESIPKGQRLGGPHTSRSHLVDGGFPPPLLLEALRTGTGLLPFEPFPCSANSPFCPGLPPNSPPHLLPIGLLAETVTCGLTTHTHTHPRGPPFPGPLLQGRLFSSGLKY